jgi:epoxyqueuosine reductase
MSNLKQDIINKSLELGFHEIKFAEYQLLSNETKNLQTWIHNGFQADMDWIKHHVELRNDPRNLLENCQTVIVFAHSYNNGFDHLELNSHGKIARYAVGRDYHKVLKKKLKSISDFLKTKNINSRCFVDSGPVAERDWAVKSGIGARGKNSLVLNKKLGSFFFLSSMLIDHRIDADTPVKDMCGKCTKCIKACPTNAIIKPYIVDSNKCISYWTIESKAEELPDEIVKNQEKWIFGCDICQEVCPYNNHRNLIQSEPDFVPRKNTTQLNLENVKEMNQDEFIEKFAGQPIIRTKLSGLKRNAKAILKFQ